MPICMHTPTNGPVLPTYIYTFSSQVEPFFLAQAGCGTDERKRRIALLKKRNEWLSLGYREEDLPDKLQLRVLRAIPPTKSQLPDEHVWALTTSTGGGGKGGPRRVQGGL